MSSLENLVYERNAWEKRFNQLREILYSDSRTLSVCFKDQECDVPQWIPIRLTDEEKLHDLIRKEVTEAREEWAARKKKIKEVEAILENSTS